MLRLTGAAQRHPSAAVGLILLYVFIGMTKSLSWSGTPLLPAEDLNIFAKIRELERASIVALSQSYGPPRLQLSTYEEAYDQHGSTFRTSPDLLLPCATAPDSSIG
jgi:hypothetical protein